MPQSFKTFIVDASQVPSTEALAVLGALYSRSLKSVEEQIVIATQDKSEAFINKHVIGYNHDSVLDPTQTSLFLEGVSMFVAKAIQDDPKYKGIECSTRYIDFSTQRFHNPYCIRTDHLNREAAERWFARLRAFYVYAMPIQIEYNRSRFPLEEGQSATVYSAAIRAKAFDVLRAFLPGGATTNLSWVGDLRTISQRLQEMRFHPLPEVSDLAYTLVESLRQRYPASIKRERMTLDQINFLSDHAEQFFYLTPAEACHGTDAYNIDYADDFNVIYDRTESIRSAAYTHDFLEKRPKGGVIPRMPSHPGVRHEYTMDFGSFRDMQRHRNCVQKIPLLSTKLGFETWYMENLAPALRQEAEILLYDFESMIDVSTPSLKKDRFKLQYLIPMGYRVPNVIHASIPQTVYMAELRSSRFVHPTARRAGLHMANFLERHYSFIKIYPDHTQSDWDIRRGTHDITSK